MSRSRLSIIRYYGTLPRSFWEWKHSLSNFWQYYSCVLTAVSHWALFQPPCPLADLHIYRPSSYLDSMWDNSKALTLKAVMVNSKPVWFWELPVGYSVVATWLSASFSLLQFCLPHFLTGVISWNPFPTNLLSITEPLSKGQIISCSAVQPQACEVYSFLGLLVESSLCLVLSISKEIHVSVETPVYVFMIKRCKINCESLK